VQHGPMTIHLLLSEKEREIFLPASCLLDRYDDWSAYSHHLLLHLRRNPIFGFLRLIPLYTRLTFVPLPYTRISMVTNPTCW